MHLTSKQCILDRNYIFSSKNSSALSCNELRIDGDWGKGGKCQNKVPQRCVNKYNPYFFSYCTTTAFYQESGKKFNCLLCTNAFQVASPASHENTAVFYTLWIRRSSLFSQPDLFYFVQYLDTPGSRNREAVGLCVLQMHNYQTHTKKKKTKKPTNKHPPHTPPHNNKTLNVSLSFLLSSGQYHVHKVERDWKKGVEGNSDKKLFQVHWQVTYLRSEKKLHCTLYLKLGRKQIAAWTFFHVLKSFSQ